ncbi:MAG: hypothetical protein FJY07_10460 [Bacteroidetes bacterium]|nr:hypothetical protein [Bacteroidota bacterium]
MNSKKIQVVLIAGLMILVGISCDNRKSAGKKDLPGTEVSIPDTSDRTNNFYDNAETYMLTPVNLTLAGEIANPGMVNTEELPLHSVIVKETLLSDNGDTFVGAYRYDGYSLFDILNLFKIAKVNEPEFPPIIDLFIEVENSNGDLVRISWGEIYYPNHLHEIIIATRVTRIVPSKTKDLWPLPKECKLVCAADLITERNISSPVKITIKSYPKSLVTVKGMSPVFSPDFKIFVDDQLFTTIYQISPEFGIQTYNTIFYGRGRGIHSTQPFQGFLLKEIIKRYSSVNRDFLQKGLILIAAKDGGRGVFTASEVMNRNDQAELLLVHKPDETDGGAFRLFPAGDFFSDRAIKAIESIYISTD